MTLTLITMGIVMIFIAAYFAVGNYFYNYALKAKKKKDFLDNNPNLAPNKSINIQLSEAAKQADRDFEALHVPLELNIISKDKLHLRLKAYMFENIEGQAANHKWAIVVHGYTAAGKWMTRWIRKFYEQGYNVLALDLRGHGKSEGHYIGMGWHDRLDLVQWIGEVTDRDPEAEIALFGISMGAATVMMASGEKLPSNVKVIVEDCGYSSVGEVFAYQLKDLFKLPEFPVMNAASTATKLRAGYSIYGASTLEQLAQSKVPTLFIHGDKDTFVPFEMLDKVYAAAPVEKQKLVIKGAGHGEAEVVDPELYWNTTWGFVKKYIK